MTEQTTTTPKNTVNLFKEHWENLPNRKQTEFKEFVNDTLQKKSRTTLYNWINGETEPTATEKKAIADFFEVDVKQLFANSK